MAFPTTGVLDSFDRADSASLGASWTPQFDSFKIVSNQCAVTTSDTYTAVLYGTAFANDQEVYLTLSTISTVFNYGRLWVRSSSSTDPEVASYSLSWDAEFGTITVNDVTSTVETQLGATITQSLSSGDSVGLSIIGSTITVYYKASGGSWNSLATRTDSAHSTGAYLAMEVYGKTASRFDNFGGGSIGLHRLNLLGVG